MRSLMVFRMTALASGTLSTRNLNCSVLKRSTRPAVVALMPPSEGEPSIMGSSPKKSPALYLFRDSSRPLMSLMNSTAPSTRIKKLGASPSRINHSPAHRCTSADFSASRCSLSSGTDSKRGICFSSSAVNKHTSPLYGLMRLGFAPHELRSPRAVPRAIIAVCLP